PGELIIAARLSSLADETPEGRSIVDLANDAGVNGPELVDLRNTAEEITIVEFTASTRMSGVDLDGRLIRKGAASAVEGFVTEAGGQLP
ncbi:potassium-transporting ATPase subunit B, partial [Chryseobacterium sp. SIMBA_028]